MTLGDAQRVEAVARLEHDIALAPQHFAGQRAHGVFILDEQHRLPPALPGRL